MQRITRIATLENSFIQDVSTKDNEQALNKQLFEEVYLKKN
jgi:hypothetical protein